MDRLLERELSRGQAFLIAIGVMLGLAVLGTLLAGGGLGTWYEGLAKPSWLIAPEGFLVVATLYYVVGITLLSWLLQRRPSEERSLAITLAFGMVLANEIWNGLFLGMQSVTLGLAGMVGFAAIAWGLQAALVRLNFRREALLLAPYSIWVAYDLAWAFELWRLNG
ncbi:MAG: tryptophan-rich sensory protein [Dehalococcoidia bacterium]|nr:tryptophan-rich sensory protein [Dehalococcoidia bacterium]